jgi:hypothetical protein
MLDTIDTIDISDNYEHPTHSTRTTFSVVKPYRLTNYYNSVPVYLFTNGKNNLWYRDRVDRIIIVLMNDGHRTIIDDRFEFLIHDYKFVVDSGVVKLLPTDKNGGEQSELVELVELSHMVIGINLFDDEYVRYNNFDTMDNREVNLSVVKKYRQVKTRITGIMFERNKYIFTARYMHNGKNLQSSFSCNKYGYQTAFKMAAYQLLVWEVRYRKGRLLTYNNPYQFIIDEMNNLPLDPIYIAVKPWIDYIKIGVDHMVELTTSSGVYRILVDDESDVRLFTYYDFTVDKERERVLLKKDNSFVDYSVILYDKNNGISHVQNGGNKRIVHLNCNTFDYRYKNLMVIQNDEKIHNIAKLKFIHYQVGIRNQYCFQYYRDNKRICYKSVTINDGNENELKKKLSKLLLVKYHASKIFDEIRVTRTGIIEFIYNYIGCNYEFSISEFIMEMDRIDRITNGYELMSVYDRIDRELSRAKRRHSFLSINSSAEYYDIIADKRHKEFVSELEMNFNMQFD